MNPITPNISSLTTNIPIVPKNYAQKRLMEAAQAMEAVFSGYILKGMGEGLPGTPGSTGGEIFGGMFQEALSQQIAKSQSLGISKTIYQKTANIAEKQAGAEGLKPLPGTTL